MRELALAITICLISVNLQAQQHDNVWLVGYTGLTTKIEFGTGVTVTPNLNRNLAILRMYASICDSLGNLQFYSNGVKIHNAQYQLMQNGDSLNPGQVANDFFDYYIIEEGAIAIPHPKQVNKYYLFHQAASYATINAGLAEHLRYSLIDMNANSGLGAVEKKNQILVSDSICGGQLEVVRHGNGKDWWLIQPLGGSNGFHVFLVAGDTVILSSKQYIGNNNRFAGNEVAGQAAFSPDGSKYARYDFENDLDIFDFDRCSGILSTPLHIAIQDSFDVLGGAGGGVAFSPNNRYLYIPSLLLIYQFDLFASDIAASKDTVAIYDGFRDTIFPGVYLGTGFGYIQLAPNGKIYGYAEATKYLHVIHNPDSGGVACNVEQHGLYIHHGNGHFIPNFPHYRTGALTGSPCDTLTSTIALDVGRQQEEWEVILYPNPTSHELTIQSNLAFGNNASIEIFNALGQLIKTKLITAETNNVTIDASSLLDGIYIMRLKNGENTVTKSFVVAK